MKKSVILLVFTLFALGVSAKTIRPIAFPWTVKNIPDGEYFVYVDWNSAQVSGKKCFITFDIRLPERYTAAMLDAMAVGDYIQVDSKLVKVTRKDYTETGYILNRKTDDPEDEYSGIYFIKNYGGYYFTDGYFIPSELALPPEFYFHSHGKVRLQVMKLKTECDRVDQVSGTAIPSFVRRHKRMLKSLNCSRIQVKNGKVVLLTSVCAL